MKPAAVIRRLYDRLHNHYGPQSWWPAESPLEVIVGAVLTQNTSWKNVERAIENLRAAGKLELNKLHRMSHEKLAELIRPAGYFRLKAGRLKNVLRFIVETYGGVEPMHEVPLDRLREELLAVNGVGPETADSILLYAFDKPSFVVDLYTARVLKRHGWLPAGAKYHDIKDWFESHLASDAERFNEYHALLVRVGNGHCRRTPNCEQCPLKPLLPKSGPLPM